MTTKTHEYYNMVSKIPYPYGNDLPIFNTQGKLIIALFEFRPLEDIHSVINAVLQVYNSFEIGLAIVYGKNNKDFIEAKYEKWKNIVLVNTGDGNHNALTYSNRLMSPELWERFKNWSHVLVYQCDALLLRKIPEVYFTYDYIGAPWPKGTKHWKLGGNGGFSLRKVSSMIKVCEPFRNKTLDELKCPLNHEDGWFCRQSTFKYIDVIKDEELHREFAIEQLFSENPVGLHKVYCWTRNPENWEKIVTNINNKLIKNAKKNIKLNSEPFISDDYFVSKGDIILDNKYSYESVEEKLNERSQNKIVVNITLINYYLDFLLNIRSGFILISLCDVICMPYGSYPITNKTIEEKYNKLLAMPNLICWYTKNPCIVHKKLKALPLGNRWKWHSYYFFDEPKTSTYNINLKYCLYAKENFEKEKDKLLYYGSMNLATTANTPYKKHKNIRKNLKNELGERFEYLGNFSYENYLKNMSEYKFIICPPGYGIDTHRCWESLLVGCIPIMIKVDSMDELYEDLPVLLVENYENITEEYLNKEYDRIKKSSYNFNKLYTDYWDKEFDKYNLSL